MSVEASLLYKSKFVFVALPHFFLWLCSRQHMTWKVTQKGMWSLGWTILSTLDVMEQDLQGSMLEIYQTAQLVDGELLSLYWKGKQQTLPV